MNSLVALLFLVGWLGTSHFLPWVSWHAEVPFFLAAFVVAWGAIFVRYRSGSRRDIALPAPAWPAAMLLGVAILQGLTGVTPFLGDAFVFSLYLLLCLICLALGFATASSDTGEKILRNCSSPSVLTLLAIVLVIGGIISVVVALAQTLQVWEASSWILRQSTTRRPGGNLGQPNHLATLLIMAIASVAYLHSSRRIGGILAVTILFVTSSGLAITESRTGALSFFVLLAWWVWKQPQIAPNGSRRWAVGVAAMFTLLFIGWPTLLEVIAATGDSTVRLGFAAGNARTHVWPQLLEAATLRPWVGWGILQTAEAHNAVAHAYSKGEPFSYSHNLVIDLVLWVGFPLAGILVFMALIWVWRRAHMIQSLLPWYGLALALPLGVHSMLEFPYAYAYFLVPVMFAVGVMERQLGQQPKMCVSFQPAVFIMLIATVASAWCVVEYLKVEDEFRVTRFELLRIGQTPANHERPTILLQTQLGLLLDSTRIELRQNMPSSELELLKMAALRYPWSATRYRYSLSLALNNQEEEASRQMHIVRIQHGEKVYSKLNQQIENEMAKLVLRRSREDNNCRRRQAGC